MGISLGPSSRMSCRDPDCSSGEFWLLPGGKITCAHEECNAVYGDWIPEGASRPGFFRMTIWDRDEDRIIGTRQVTFMPHKGLIIIVEGRRWRIRKVTVILRQPGSAMDHADEMGVIDVQVRLID